MNFTCAWCRELLWRLPPWKPVLRHPRPASPSWASEAWLRGPPAAATVAPRRPAARAVTPLPTAAGCSRRLSGSLAPRLARDRMPACPQDTLICVTSNDRLGLINTQMGSTLHAWRVAVLKHASRQCLLLGAVRCRLPHEQCRPGYLIGEAPEQWQHTPPVPLHFFGWLLQTADHLPL
jgi:hypothetical protein